MCICEWPQVTLCFISLLFCCLLLKNNHLRMVWFCLTTRTNHHFHIFQEKKKHFTPQKIGHIFTKHNFTSAAFQKHTTNYCSFNPLFLLKHNVPHWRTFLYLDCWKTFFASLIRLKTLSHGQNEPFEYEIELSWKWNPLQEHRLLFLLLSGFIVIVRWPWS